MKTEIMTRPQLVTPAQLTTKTPRQPRRARARQAQGFTLMEMVTALALLALMTFLSVPPLWRWSQGLRLDLAAQQVASAMRAARLYAIRHQAHVGLKFTTDDDGRLLYALYRDGDGDGVRSRDIARGVDPEVWAPRRLEYMSTDIRIGFPPGPAPRHPGVPSRRLDVDDPIRFNRSDMASFGPLGTATPGSIYLTDSVHRLMAVRVYHRSGKITLRTYDPEREIWVR